MQIRVLFFGVLKDLTGRSSDLIELPQGARVQDVISHYAARNPRMELVMNAMAISVNQEYSKPDHLLATGDEVGLLPPVSGGLLEAASEEAASRWRTARIVREPIRTETTVAHLKQPEDGAVAVFEGIVRNNTRGRRCLYLDYEAYEEMALKQMNDLAEQARERYAVRGVAVVHRLGRLEIGETSVLVVVTSAHRTAAFEACRWMVDTLKKTVPIWKKEYFEDGAVWADGEPFPEEIRPAGSQPGNRAHPTECPANET
jgi:MoaE-MoaD fusion protein